MLKRKVPLTTKWKHPGGKLREEGANSLTEQELLSILISSGIKGKPAERIAEEVLEKYGSLQGLANQPLDELLEIKGLSDVRIIRIAAALELARRLHCDSLPIPQYEPKRLRKYR
jgi:DNA repair protein RadC